MSRRTIFSIIYGIVMLAATLLVFLDAEVTLLAKFFLVIFFGLLMFVFLGSIWLVWEKGEARRRQLQENDRNR